MSNMDTIVKTDPSGLLDVTVSSLVLRKDITADVVMGCEVTIANTEFYIREELELFEYPSKYDDEEFQVVNLSLISLLGFKSRYTSSSCPILVPHTTFVAIVVQFLIARTY